MGWGQKAGFCFIKSARLLGRVQNHPQKRFSGVFAGEKGQRTGGFVLVFSTAPTCVACLPNNKKANE